MARRILVAFQIATSRMLYGVSKEEYHAFPAIFSRVDPSRGTAQYAVFAVGLAPIPFVFIADVGEVAGLANLMLLVVFVLVNGAVLKLRYSRPDADRGFSAPLNAGRLSLPALGGLLSCLGLIVFYVGRW